MLSPILQKAVKAWPPVSKVLFVPRSESEYDEAVSLLNELIDEVGENETHPLASLMTAIGTLIENYESQHFSEPVGSPIGCLQMLMSEHQLEAKDLVELGDETAVSEVLQGQRELTLSQIRALSQRFYVSTAVFI